MMKWLQSTDEELLVGPGTRYAETYFTNPHPQEEIELPEKVILY